MGISLRAYADDPGVPPPPPMSDDDSAQSAPTPPASQPMSSSELDTMVAPIALYPDSLLSQVFVASTYPLEIVQASQWLDANPNLKGQPLTDAGKSQSWDPSVQALLVFPDVLRRLNQDITWTTKLGNTFLEQESDVMDAVQRMRTKAQTDGKLKSTTQQKIVDTTNEGDKVIEIVPANPDVVYVPVYDPAVIWGPAPDYYYPGWYYPRPAYGYYGWDSGIHLSVYYGTGWGGWGGWGWRPHWHDRTVVVNNYFVNRYSGAHTTVVNVSRHDTTVWHHDPVHRGGVAYSSPALHQQFRGNFSHVHATGVRPAVSPSRPALQASAVQNQLHQSSVRTQHAVSLGSVSHSNITSRPSMGNTHPTTVHPINSVDHMGSHPISSGAFEGNRSAFGGIGSGANVHSYSTRGYGSLAHSHVGGTPNAARPTGGAVSVHPVSHGGGAGGGGHGGGGRK